MASRQLHLPRRDSQIRTEQHEAEGPVSGSGILGEFDYSVLDQPQGPDTGINAIIGKWPGDESEEELLALLEEIS